MAVNAKMILIVIKHTLNLSMLPLLKIPGKTEFNKNFIKIAFPS